MKLLVNPMRNNINIRKLAIGTIGFVLCSLGVYLLIFRIPYLEGNSSDFKQDYYGAQKLVSGESVYSDPEHGNNHPPFAAFIITPFVFFSYKNAIIIWSIISVILYVLIGKIVVSTLNINLNIEWKLIVTGLALCWYQFQAHIALGQLSILISVLMLGGWAFIRNNKEIFAGVLFGLAISIKLFPGLILVYLIIKKRWLCVVSTITSVIALGAFVILWVGIDDLIWFFFEVTPKNAQEWLTFPPNISISGSIAKLLVDGPWVRPIVHSPEIAQALTFIITIILLVLMAKHIQNMPNNIEGTDVAFSINLLGMIILSPIAWQHVFPLLALPFGILLLRLKMLQSRFNMRAVLFPLILVSLPDFEIGRTLMTIFAPYRMPWYAAIVFLIPTMSLFLLWYLLIREGEEGYG